MNLSQMKMERRVHRFLSEFFPDPIQGIYEKADELAKHMVKFIDDFEDNVPSALLPYIESWQALSRKRYLN